MLTIRQVEGQPRNRANHAKLNQRFATNYSGNRPASNMKASTVNPIAQIVLVVDSSERLQKSFAAHAVSPQKHQLAVDGQMCS